MSARGERDIKTERGEIRLLLTNFALAQAELKMNKPALAVAREALDGQAMVSDIAHLLRAGMEAANREAGYRREGVPLSEAYRVLDEAGYVTVMRAVVEAITAVMTYTPPEEQAPDPN